MGELITRGALSVQSEFGLVEDGLAGPNTIDAILAGMGNSQQGETLDIPSRDVKDIERVYGKFSYRDNEDRPGAIIIDPSWARKNIVQVTFHTGQKTWCHAGIADEFRELYKKACNESGYTPKSVWSYVPRHMRWDNSRPLSRHSWGIAFDIETEDIMRPNKI